MFLLLTADETSTTATTHETALDAACAVWDATVGACRDEDAAFDALFTYLGVAAAVDDEDDAEDAVLEALATAVADASFAYTEHETGTRVAVFHVDGADQDNTIPALAALISR